jgi:hypothetical protein
MNPFALPVVPCQKVDARRSRLRVLDGCLDELETAHERDQVTVSEELAGRLRPIIPGITPGMRISKAINLVLREQERYLPAAVERTGKAPPRDEFAEVDRRDGQPASVPTAEAGRANSAGARYDGSAPPGALDLPDRQAPMRELVNRTRQLVPLMDHVGQAKAMVRRAGAIQKLIGESLKGCRVLEREQFELKQDAAEAHLRTVRRAGELLAELEKHRGGRPPKTVSREEGVTERPPTLRELGIDAHESHRWQRIAGLPQETFERYVRWCRQRGRELTIAGLLALTRRPTDVVTASVLPDPPLTLLQRYQNAKEGLLDLSKVEPAALAAFLGGGRRRQELADVAIIRAWLDGLAVALRAGPGDAGPRPRAGSLAGRRG